MSPRNLYIDGYEPQIAYNYGKIDITEKEDDLEIEISLKGHEGKVLQSLTLSLNKDLNFAKKNQIKETNCQYFC